MPIINNGIAIFKTFANFSSNIRETENSFETLYAQLCDYLYAQCASEYELQ